MLAVIIATRGLQPTSLSCVTVCQLRFERISGNMYVSPYICIVAMFNFASFSMRTADGVIPAMMTSTGRSSLSAAEEFTMLFCTVGAPQ